MKCPAAVAFVVLAVMSVGRGADEVPPDASRPCFPGAYYRKAVSSVDLWSGIDVTVTLPTPVFDESRVNPKTGKFLDNPSVYVGGRAKDTEIDAGVTWEVIREKDGTVSKRGKAFRPFWRNKKWFSGPAEPKYYFHPGDTIRILCRSDAADKLTMEISVVKRAKADLAVVDEPLRVEFDAPSFGPGRRQEYKRVDAIDQSGRERKGVDKTSARVTGLVWEEVYLLRGEGRRAMTGARFTDMRCPDPKYFTVGAGPAPDKGSETVDIDAGK